MFYVVSAITQPSNDGKSSEGNQGRRNRKAWKHVHEKIQCILMLYIITFQADSDVLFYLLRIKTKTSNR